MTWEFQDRPAEPSPVTLAPIEVIDVVPVTQVSPWRSVLFYMLAVLTVGLTFGALPYCWGRSLAMVILPVADDMKPRKDEFNYVAILVAAVGASLVLSWLTARASSSTRSLAWLLGGVS